jgi:urea carboxylase
MFTTRVVQIGSINFTGDSPVILTCDGPSLGGFVCPATVAAAEMSKVRCLSLSL